jgi:hypothetical protein
MISKCMGLQGPEHRKPYKAIQKFVQQVRAIRFTRQADVGTPFQMAQFLLDYTHRLEAVLHPTCQAILTPIKVTTNKLEKVS